ncbi:amino acid adenylation domain-containing protein [Nocardia sp. NPDC052566]|uniref:amino acid adenylation domain-containing protein n=1 Tax=Nocardia sp. NPDC052566 TaxID=3364330 RepID=UPI0037C53C39
MARSGEGEVRAPVEVARSLLDLLDAQVRRDPDAIACVDDSRALSYRELAERAAAGAGALRAAGVVAGNTVGILLSPSVDLVVAVWAVLRAGASYLPLAVDYPAARIAYMATDSDIRVVLTDQDADVRVLPARISAISVPEATSTDWAPDTVPSGAARVYTIYTSGTTGSPKGVVISHRAIVNQMIWLGAELGLGPGTRILLKTPVSFDAAQWELLANACGATVVVARAGTHTSPEAILDYVRREAITTLQCVPTMWSELAALPDIGTAGTLHTVVSGGEALPSALAERLRAVLPGPRKINLYGPTEATINATWFDFTAADDSGAVIVPIGTEVDGCRTVVVDQDGRRIDDARVGELLISGVQLADGYRGRPDATAERFPELTFDSTERWYRTGDLVRRRADGILEFVGRDDEQVKVNGHRVETNEVRVAIEKHHWVRAAAVVPWLSERGVTQLAGFIELDPDEAPLMDQGQAGRHHRSKSTRTQVTAQLSDLAIRQFDTEPEIPLAGAAPTAEQRRRVFARKTYRTFTDAPIDLGDIEALLRRLPKYDEHQGSSGRALSAARIGELLRWFGPFHSPDRLLPKYSYASPGALNATRIYLETSGLPGLDAGVYYFHPLRHSLFRVGDAARGGLHVHLVGLPEVIESVYSTNVREVLHFEAGHILGVLDEVSAEYGWQVRPACMRLVDGLDKGVVVATVAVTESPAPAQRRCPLPVTVFVQVHGEVGDARHGLYRFTGAGLEFVTEQKIERRHVIAINQRSYDQSSFGILLATDADAGWDGFTELGRALAHLQQLGARAGIGLMSAGYSSLTGRDLPSARRFRAIADEGPLANSLSYFALAGPVSAEQLGATGMAEDALHMQGPEELLKDDLRAVLPHYMVPPTIHVLDRIPLSQNGKQDRAGLVRLAGELNARHAQPSEPPTAGREAAVAAIWSRVLDYEPVYRADDFFARGGNSISALRLIRALDEELGTTLGVQTIFRAPTLAQLAAATIDTTPNSARTPRFLRLAEGDGSGTTVLWPGLGGYPMSLRALASELAEDGHTVYGVQARGINSGERPHDSLDALIADDVEEFLGLGHAGPLRIIGYSFGARVAAEVAQRLSAQGHRVDQLVLIAPGSPVIAGITDDTAEVGYRNRYFKRVLASVFSGRVDPGYALDLDKRVERRAEFVDLIVANEPGFAREVVERIVAVVEHTYRLRARPSGVDPELLDASLFLRARGDGPSFADIPVAPLRLRSGRVSNLPYHHYEIVTAGAADVAAAVARETLDRELV